MRRPAGPRPCSCRCGPAQGCAADALPGWADDPVLATLVEPAAAGRLVLTRRGRLLANEVALRLHATTGLVRSSDRPIGGTAVSASAGAGS